MSPNADIIAECVLRAVSALPAKFKPRSLADGRKEWTPVAGIVLSKGDVREPGERYLSSAKVTSNGRREDSTAHVTCVALATGMKCLPAAKLSLANGNVLHDWHAEILALRAFNRWILDECKSLVESGQTHGEWIGRRAQSARTRCERDSVYTVTSSGHSDQPFIIRNDVNIHMYCSEAPCGDASMELVMSAQEDATPWPEPAPSETEDGMLGRGHFDQLGVVRRKPARPDAPVTLSKSCSDKLSMKQCTSLLSSLTNLIVHPANAYLETLVLPQSQLVAPACDRAFGPAGRMAAVTADSVVQDWQERGYRYQPFKMEGTTREFEFSRRSAVPDAVASNLSAVWTAHRQEVLINGVLQGRKQFDTRGASCVSRRQMWKEVSALVVTMNEEVLYSAICQGTYGMIKGNDLLRARRLVKSQAKQLALQRWRDNSGDDDWSI
ncbi:hypothetical protein K431DRAFT_312338 [Polychaeton citri CBS 116435]|uniref:A to I editase domain-containing protein n=1 Tax=Polychaeton citri CBS 116435 TaxID=1314669 RepID=A0A9P4QBE6_9PEZI|nr:hypothetical protein K431DRAFT_312338 [Polychaeton citri CBS 116435]